MKSNELRIGNYVSYGGEIVRVTAIGQEYVYIDRITLDYVNRDDVEPVELTEEWLVNFGFKKIEDKLFGMDEFRMGTYSFSLYNFSLDNGWGIVNKQPIKYVHQLQSLYFALTKEELILTD
jgi:hypothetical protein